MTRPIAIVGASSSIGIRPYDDGEMRQRWSRAPDARERTIRRLDATDLVTRHSALSRLCAAPAQGAE